MAVVIDIVGSFSGKKAFKQAESSVSALDKTAAKLGKSIAGVFATEKIVAFSKQSIAAYMADQKAAASLSNQLKNIGYGSATRQAEDFIATLQSQTGVLDDSLRPAYSQLARVTGSLEKTQKLMALAFDVSSGAGVDYQSAIDALSQAYVGNTKGLKKLNSGLTAADLKTKSFAEITDYLSKKFSGAGAAALDTYAGKMSLLQVATANAQETVGKGFIDAFSQIANDGDFKTVTKAIDDMALNTANTLIGIGSILGNIRSTFDSMPSWLKSTGGKLIADIAGGPGLKILSGLNKYGAQKSADQAAREYVKNSFSSHQGYAADQAKKNAASLKIQQEQKRRDAAALAAQKQTNKLTANNLKLQKAAAVFDMKKIQITAALKSATDAETKTRLELMLAIENEQGTLAEKLQKKLDEIIAKNKTLQSDLDSYKTGLASIPSVDPFGNALVSLNGIIATIPTYANLLKGLPYQGEVWATNAPQGIASGNYLSSNPNMVTNAPTSIVSGAYLNPNVTSTPNAPAPVVNNNVTVNGAIDPVSTAQQVAQVLAQSAASTGSYNNLGFSWLQALGMTP